MLTGTERKEAFIETFIISVSAYQESTFYAIMMSQWPDESHHTQWYLSNS